MKSFFRKIITLCASALILGLAGCASFPQNQIAPVTDMPSVTQYTHKPSVYFDVRFFRGNPDTPNAQPAEVGGAESMARSVVEKQAHDSGLFSSYSFDQSKQADADYTIQLYYYNYGSQGAAFAAGFITGFTFGVIPTAATDHYTLRASLTAKGSTAPQTLSSQDSMSTWIGLWFIPMMGHTPQKGVQSTLGNMTLAAFKQMITSGQLKYSVLDERRLFDETPDAGSAEAAPMGE